MFKMELSLFAAAGLCVSLAMPAGAQPAVRKHPNPVHERRQAMREEKKEVYGVLKRANKQERKELKEEIKDKKQEIVKQNIQDRKALKKDLDLNGDGVLSKEELAVGAQKIEAMRAANKAEWDAFQTENAEALKALQAQHKTELQAAKEAIDANIAK